MSRRRLGDTTVEVTGLGLGGAGLGNLFRSIDDETAEAIVDAAWDAGIRYFDTAPHYGLGLSERRLGHALADHPRDAYVVSTKVGRLLVDVGEDIPDDEGFAVTSRLRRRFDYSADGVRRSLDASLERLGLDRVDIALIHDPDDHMDEAISSAVPALEALRDEGLVRAIGVGMNRADLLTRFVDRTNIDVVMCAGRYTLLEQPALNDLLPASLDRGVSVLVAGAFNSGLLASATVSDDAHYDYAPAPAELVAKARRLAAELGKELVTLPQAALNFPFGHPTVASVVVGASAPSEVVENVWRFDAPVPTTVWERLRVAGLLPPEVPVPGGNA